MQTRSDTLHNLKHPIRKDIARLLLICTGFYALLQGAHPALCFIVLAPYFITIMRPTHPFRAFMLGWLAGTSIWLIATHWVFYGALLLLDWSVTGSFIATLIFAAWQGLPYAITGLLICLLSRHYTLPPFTQAAILTLTLFLVPTLLPGSVELELYRWPQAIQIADLGGALFVGFIVLWINALMASAINSLSRKEPFLPALAQGALILSLTLIYGQYQIHRFEQMEKHTPSENSLSVLAIQPAIPVVNPELYVDGKQVNTIAYMKHQTQLAIQQHGETDLIVWPEYPKSPNCNCSIWNYYKIAETLTSKNSALLATCLEHAYAPSDTSQPASSPTLYADAEGILHPVTDSPLDSKTTPYPNPDRILHLPDSSQLPHPPAPKLIGYYNSSLLIQNNECLTPHRKVKLVPFGEATPFRKRFPALHARLGRQYEYIRANAPGQAILASKKSVQPLICYEILFPNLVREAVAQGADILINPANDGWFNSPQAARLHLALALFRSIEQRRPLVRVTNIGFGAHIQASGIIHPNTLTPHNEPTSISARLFIPTEKSLFFYIQHHWLILVMILAIYKLKRRARRGFKAICASCQL
jgi:apolipoprotein N-acyltransferase